MKKSYKILLFVTIFAAIGAGLLLKIVFGAGAASLSLSPNSGSHDTNSNFTVGIYEDSGAENINSIQADLNYDQTKLQLVSIDTSTSAFGVAATASGGNGAIDIQRGNITPLTGSHVVANLVFKVLGGSGTTAISFANSSLIYRSSDNTDIWNHTTPGGSYTLTTPPSNPNPPPPPPQPPPAPQPNPNPNPNPPPVNPANPATPVAVDLEAAGKLSELEKIKDSAASSYFVVVKVVSVGGKVVTGAKVQVDSQIALTDASGIANFLGVTAGSHRVTASTSNSSSKATIFVAKEDIPGSVQAFTIILKPSSTIPTILASGALLLVILLGVWILLKSRTRRLQIPQSRSQKPLIQPTSNQQLPGQITEPVSGLPVSELKSEEEDKTELPT